MRHAVTVPNFGEFADPTTLAEVAARAERAGWDALFVWDHVAEDRSQRRRIADPWILLTAAALATRRIRLGTMITPVARRRPQKLAREVTTLDRLSGGRMVLGVGLGAPVEDEYGAFGETTDQRQLAARLDEGLDVLDRLWSGERVDYAGEHVVVHDMAFAPTPVQRPRVPIWVGGNWPNRGPRRRAARWDGAVLNLPGWMDGIPPSGELVGDVRAFFDRERAGDGRADEHFDLVTGGRTDPADAGRTLEPIAAAGATWWNEQVPFTDPALDRAAPILERVDAGPA